MNAKIDYEILGAQIHEYYSKRWPGFLPNLYSDLPEFMKEDNRAAGRRIGTVLAAVGLRLEPRDGTEWSDKEKADVRSLIEANLELIAEAEHDGWVETRLRQGWRPALQKPTTQDEKRANFDQRLQHLLCDYAEMPPKEREKDHDAVRNYVDIISQTKYRIVFRIPHSAGD